MAVVDRIVRGYHARYSSIRLATQARLLALWADVGGVDDEAEAVFPRRAAAFVGAAQQTTVRLFEGYVGMLLQAAGVRPLPGSLRFDDVTGAAVRSGVSLLEVYRRPIVTARTALNEGRMFADAMRLAANRVAQLSVTDVALAQRAAAAAVFERDDRIVGYRRVLSGRSCSLCSSAADETYRRGELMPIHAGCDCGVAPIIGRNDPGRTVNRSARGDRRAPDGDELRGRVEVRQHGEMGPVLVDSAHHFTGESEALAR